MTARRLVAGVLLGSVVTLVAPAAAVSAEATLTLTAPGATRFGHVVDFAGRLSPAAPGTRVSLMRGTTLVAATAIKPGGSYRLQVSLGRPGPFHAVAGGVVSKPVTVRIVPELRTRLVGSRVAGQPLSLVVRLQPGEAGAVRVRVVRDGLETYRGSFFERTRVRVQLGTAQLAPFAVAVDVLPAKGYGYVRRRVPIALRAPTVGYGYEGSLVSRLLDRLRELGYATPSSRAVFDSDVQQGVYAFQKAQRLERTGVADAAFWRRLERPVEIVPRRRHPANHIEIDKARQILMVVRDGRVVLISPVSTGGGYWTPEGRFSIIRKVPGYDPSPLGVLYKPMYFYGGYAIHGNPSVPPYPASHGCVRVPNFVADRLYGTQGYGEVVIIYS